MKLIDRYVHEVGRYIPRRQRGDILEELRSLLVDTLEDNYGEIMQELRQDAQRLDRAWLDHVRTQEGLEQWAEEVRQRHQSVT